MKKFIKKIQRIFLIIKAYLFRNECAFLRIVENEALDYLESCEKLEVKNTEDVQDLLFHIRSYFDIPLALRTTMFSDIPIGFRLKLKMNKWVKVSGDSSVINRYIEYLTEIEKQRAVERTCILDCMKNVPFSSIF